MTLYEVLAPPNFSKAQSEQEREEMWLTLQFIPHSYSFWAFLFPLPWLLIKRMWLVFFGYLLLMIIIPVIGMRLGMPFVGLLGFALAAFLGFEAHALLIWSLKRKGWKALDIVYGINRETAESRFFESRKQDDSLFKASGSFSQRRYETQAQAFNPSSPSIVGLFPDGKTY
jgi:hypothetical protein